METLTNMKNTAEQGKRETDKEILRLESELHKLKTMRQPPQSVAATVHETLLPRANYRESGSVYTKTKPGSLAKANSKADGQLASLKKFNENNRKKWHFSEGRTKFLFRSTLEFTRLDKAKVKAIIKELKEDLDLTKSSARTQTRSSKYVVASRRIKK